MGACEHALFPWRQLWGESPGREGGTWDWEPWLWGPRCPGGGGMACEDVWFPLVEVWVGCGCILTKGGCSHLRPSSLLQALSSAAANSTEGNRVSVSR